MNFTAKKQLEQTYMICEFKQFKESKKLVQINCHRHFSETHSHTKYEHIIKNYMHLKFHREEFRNQKYGVSLKGVK